MFVSADAVAVTQLKSGLEDMRSKWEVEFAADASAALAATGQTLFDAAIVDLLLPESAGRKLLEDMIERSPETLRKATDARAQGTIFSLFAYLRVRSRSWNRTSCSLKRSS